jgi:calcyphosin
MSQERENVVRAAFDKMACGRSSLEMGDIAKGFDASKHPAVLMGAGSEQDVY